MNTRKLYIVRPRDCQRASTKEGSVAHFSVSSANLEASKFADSTFFYSMVDTEAFFIVPARYPPSHSAKVHIALLKKRVTGWKPLSPEQKMEELALEEVDFKLSENKDSSLLREVSKRMKTEFVMGSPTLGQYSARDAALTQQIYKKIYSGDDSLNDCLDKSLPSARRKIGHEAEGRKSGLGANNHHWRYPRGR